MHELVGFSAERRASSISFSVGRGARAHTRPSRFTRGTSLLVQQSHTRTRAPYSVYHALAHDAYTTTTRELRSGASRVAIPR